MKKLAGSAKDRPRQALSSVFNRLKTLKSLHRRSRPLAPDSINIEETRPLDPDSIGIEETRPLDPGSIGIEETRPLDPGSIGIEETRPLDSNSISVEETRSLDSDSISVEERRPLDSNWIDIKEIQRWLTTCDRDHVEDCHASLFQPDARPLWLIDVVRECIVPAKEHRYVALSYVWGGVDTAQTTKANIDILQSPGSMSEESPTVQVPRTIRHAMGLTRLLGEKYLWVDRFCICQDDAARKHSQLQLMADIYGNAYLTIIAANGWDAHHGLRGIRGVTGPRELSYHLDFELYKDYVNPNNSVWFSRGWTFQEEVFSRRRLLFQQQVVKWECRCCVWHESTLMSRMGRVPLYFDGGFWTNKPKSQFFSWHDPMFAYNKAVCSYNIRNLTFPEDGLSAFLGVLHHFTPLFPQGFFWGLPISEFHSTLLWQPREELTRRRPRCVSSSPLPSWSWVGWQGSIDTEPCLMAGRMRLKPLCSWRTWQGSNMCEIAELSPATSGSHDSFQLVTSAPVARAWLPRIYSAYLAVHDILMITSEMDKLKACGVMLAPSNGRAWVSQECELVAISMFEEVDVRDVVGVLGEEFRFLAIEFQIPSPKATFVNVMWIGRRDGVAYRKGLGIMLAEGWDSLNPEMMDITIM